MGANRADRLAAAPISSFRSFALLSAILICVACSSRPSYAQTPLQLRDVLSAERWSRDVAAFYDARGYRSAWFKDDAPLPSYTALEEFVERLAEQALDPLDYQLPPAGTRAVEAELQTTATALRLAGHLLRGRVNPRSVYSRWNLRGRARDLPAALSAAVDDQDLEGLFRTLEPSDASYRNLKSALAAHRDLQANGGWPGVDTRRVLHPGDTSEAVIGLRKRLQPTFVAAPLQPTRVDVYDEQLERAVTDFQERHGLEVDGIVGRRTFEALNTPIDQRIVQIALNMEKWRWMPERREGKYVEVNIPAYEAKVVEDGRTIMQMRVIVGTPSTRTPVFSTRIEEVVLAPYWIVPRSIEVHEVLPRLERDPGYLQRNHIHRIPSGMLRQDPGPSNPLGRIKFTIPNPYGIGLHDTPERHLFDRTTCAFSHGCVRLERPEDLAVHLLAGTEWSRSRIRATIDKWKEIRIPLDRPLPLHILYWTTWVDDEGRIQFRNDIYGLDERLLRVLKSE